MAVTPTASRENGADQSNSSSVSTTMLRRGGSATGQATGVRLGATNVVVEAVQYQGGAGVIGAEAELVGQGRVWVLSAGQVTVGTWRRSSASDPGQLIGTDGTPIVLAPGPTWVELPDVSYPITIP